MREYNDLIAEISRLDRMLRRNTHHDDEDNISHMKYNILRNIRRQEGLRASKLAHLIDIRPASATEALNSLEKEGYIQRRADPTDSRVRKVFLTSKGRDYLDKKDENHQEENHKLLNCLTEEETECFFALSEKLRNFLEEDRRDEKLDEKKEQR